MVSAKRHNLLKCNGLPMGMDYPDTCTPVNEASKGRLSPIINFRSWPPAPEANGPEGGLGGFEFVFCFLIVSLYEPSVAQETRRPLYQQACAFWETVTVVTNGRGARVLTFSS